MAKSVEHSGGEKKDLNAQELFQKYELWVVGVARRLAAKTDRWDLLEDLRQEGLIAMWQAYEKYDPNQGASFQTYAGPSVKGVMIDLLMRGATVHVPRRDVQSWLTLRKKMAGDAAQNREPLSRALQEELGWTAARVNAALSVPGAQFPVPFDAPRNEGEDDLTLAETLPSDHDPDQQDSDLTLRLVLGRLEDGDLTAQGAAQRIKAVLGGERLEDGELARLTRILDANRKAGQAGMDQIKARLYDEDGRPRRDRLRLIPMVHSRWTSAGELCRVLLEMALTLDELDLLLGIKPAMSESDMEKHKSLRARLEEAIRKRSSTKNRG